MKDRFSFGHKPETQAKEKQLRGVGCTNSATRGTGTTLDQFRETSPLEKSYEICLKESMLYFIKGV